MGNLTAYSGTATTVVYYTPTTPGIHLLRYIPISSTGHRGNITYVYVYVRSENCNPSACDLVNNGGFENSQYCGQMHYDNPSPAINCWESFSSSPDLYVRKLYTFTIHVNNCTYFFMQSSS